MAAVSFTDPSGVIHAQASSMGIPVSDPGVASAIASVQAAAQSEGLDPNSLESAARITTLFQSFQGIYGKLGSGTANAAQTALTAARQFVTQNHELSGAIDTASGLVAAASAAASGGSTPQDVAANFSGPLIALMVTTGAVSAGLGAAIVGGLAIAAGLLDSAGVFPNRPGFEVCPGFKVQNKPDYAINCMAVYDPIATAAGGIAPKSHFWRSFPEPKNPSDAWWFDQATNSSPTSFSWQGATWVIQKKALMGSAMDETFPEWWAAHQPYADMDAQGNICTSYHCPGGSYESMGIVPSLNFAQFQALRDFTGAFFQAWKANKEYWLNGHSGATDAQVLQHVAEVWNRSHEPGQVVPVGPAKMYNMAGGPPISYGPYWATLIPQLGYAASDLLTPDGTHLKLNTGPLKKHAPSLTFAGLAFLRPAVHVPPAKPAVHPIHVALGHAPSVAAAVKGATIGPPKPSLWQRVKPWAPLGVGAVTFPLVGSGALVVLGAAGTALWLEGRHKGWKLPKPHLPKLHLPKL